MGLNIPKKKQKSLVERIVGGGNNQYAFKNLRFGVAVLFTMPSHTELERLYNLADYGFVKDSDVEDYIWDKYIIDYVIKDPSEERLEGLKASIVNAIMMSSIINDIDGIGYVGQLMESNSSHNDLMKSYIVSHDRTVTFDSLSTLTTQEIVHRFVLILGENKMTLKEWIGNIKKEINTVSKTTDSKNKEQTIADILSESQVSKNRNNGANKNFQRVEGADAARRSDEYSDVFKKLDYISKTKMSDLDVQEKFNITGEVDGVYLLGGKIIDDSAPPPAQTNARKRVKAKRVIGS